MVKEFLCSFLLVLLWFYLFIFLLMIHLTSSFFQYLRYGFNVLFPPQNFSVSQCYLLNDMSSYEEHFNNADSLNHSQILLLFSKFWWDIKRKSLAIWMCSHTCKSPQGGSVWRGRWENFVFVHECYPGGWLEVYLLPGRSSCSAEVAL